MLSHVGSYLNVCDVCVHFFSTGPTTAAGAIGGAEILQNYLMSSENYNSSMDQNHIEKTRVAVEEFIQNNNSFGFYRNLSHYHIVTGHTGTNVMDLHLLYFKQGK